MIYNLKTPEERNDLIKLSKNPAFYIFSSIFIALNSVFLTSPTASIGASIFSMLLIALTLIDIKTLTLPDILTLPGLILGLVLSPLMLNLPWVHSFLGAAVGFGMFWGLFWGYLKLKGYEGMGYGDIKLLALLGAWCGITGLLPILLIASFSGILAFILRSTFSGKKGSIPMPFGPFLAFGGWCTLLFENEIWHTIFETRAWIINLILGG